MPSTRLNLPQPSARLNLDGPPTTHESPLMLRGEPAPFHKLMWSPRATRSGSYLYPSAHALCTRTSAPTPSSAREPTWLSEKRRKRSTVLAPFQRCPMRLRRSCACRGFPNLPKRFPNLPKRLPLKLPKTEPVPTPQFSSVGPRPPASPRTRGGPTTSPPGPSGARRRRTPASTNQAGAPPRAWRSPRSS